MATRMQQRRGTAEQWTLADPVLAEGEIGFESDTGNFKVGNGVDFWFDLPYFQNADTLAGSLDDYVPLTEKASANGVATLDATGNVPATQLGNVDFTGYATETYADQAETDAKSYTDTLIGDGTVDGTTGNTVTDRIATAVSNLVDSAPSTLDTLNELAAALADDPNFATTVATQIGGKADASHTHVISDVTNLQSTLDGKAATSHTHTASQITDLTTNVVSRTNGTVATASTSSTVVRNITLSTLDPTGGADGDVWLKYTA